MKLANARIERWRKRKPFQWRGWSMPMSGFIKAPFPDMRTLILFLARNNAASMADFLSGLRPQIDQSPGTEVLVIDDASSDNTYEAAKTYKTEAGMKNLRLIRTADAQGIGGN